MLAKHALPPKSYRIRPRAVLLRNIILIHEVRVCHGDEGHGLMATERAKRLAWLLERGGCLIHASRVERIVADQRLRLSLYMEHAAHDAPTFSHKQPPLAAHAIDTHTCTHVHL